jgi:hypothetical protein
MGDTGHEAGSEKQGKQGTHDRDSLLLIFVETACNHVDGEIMRDRSRLRKAQDGRIAIAADPY